MDNVISIVKKSNQRGGRMLSIIDLLEAGTLDLDKSGWLVSRIEAGASFLVGAKPGGAGKTTVMGALLIMLPAGTELYLTGRNIGVSEVLGSDVNRNSAALKYIVSYEISPAFYEGYVWGKPLREMFSKTDMGLKIAANLHADTLEDAKYQIITENGVPEHRFNRCEIFVPITLNGWKRKINRIVYYDEQGRLWKDLSSNRTQSMREIEIQDFLKYCVKTKIRLIEEVREAWLSWR